MKKNGQLAAISDFVGELLAPRGGVHTPPAKCLCRVPLSFRPQNAGTVTSPSRQLDGCWVYTWVPGHLSFPPLHLWALWGLFNSLHAWGSQGSWCEVPHQDHTLDNGRTGPLSPRLGSSQRPHWAAWTGKVAARSPQCPLLQVRMRSLSSSSLTGPSWCFEAWMALSATGVAPTSWTPTARCTMSST